MNFIRFPRRLPRLCAAIAMLCLSAHPIASQERDAGLDPAIRPGDVIRMAVWQEEDLTGEFLVDQHGLVTLPLVGEVNAGEHSELSLRELVRARVRTDVWNPSIQITVLKRVRVLGEVLEPGVFHLDPTMSVADALAQAGGRTPLAKEGEVLLRRADATVTTDVRASALLAELEVRTGDELLVPRQAWVNRNSGPLISAATAVISLLVVYAVQK